YLLDTWPTTPEGLAAEVAAANTRIGGFLPKNRKYKSKFTEQFPLILHRAARHVFRDKMVVGVRLMQTLVFAVIFDLIYWQIPDRDQDSQVQDRTGILFFIVVMLIISNAISILTIFSTDRSAFERERRNGMYGLPAFFFSKLGVELPFYIVTPLLLVTITYWALGLNPNAGRFFITCLVAVLLSFVGVSIGLTAASFFRDLPVALAVVPTIIMPMMIFAGLFVNLAGMPVWIRWIKWLSVMKYAYVALAKNEFSGAMIGCGSDVPATKCVPMPGDAIIRKMGLEDQGSVWLNIGVLVAWWLLLTLFSYLGLWRMTNVNCGNAKTK
ncbi:ABC-2 type transporter-domain-containing protein, partial [Thamnocephalis sphaerospora]